MQGKDRSEHGRPSALCVEPDEKLVDVPARRRGRPLKGQSETLTQSIIDVATDLFLTDGFRATSMDAIAARTGSSKRTLYARFPSKLHLFDEVAARFAHRRQAVFERAEGSGEPLVHLLQKVARDLLEDAVSIDSIAMFRLLVAEGYRLPELKLIGHERLFEPMIRTVSTILAEAVQRGEVVDLDPVLIAEQFIEAVSGREVRRIAFGYEPAGMTPERLARLSTVVSLFLDGISAPRRGSLEQSGVSAGLHREAGGRIES
ncbi:TetR/AcrR family transcriptional regulator [Aureimonas pseudogalii]|uniref:TetR/AcrR family transcriptional regulator n=1 Tax=Aureimonas pseudogalii TaxID=1744844 RepID=UPI001AEEBA73|nr:TetR/AcrR family transcriptional regulator [Aureimonas pseudogalii]